MMEPGRFLGLGDTARLFFRWIPATRGDHFLRQTHYLVRLYVLDTPAGTGARVAV